MDHSSSLLNRPVSLPLLKRLLAQNALHLNEVKSMAGYVRQEQPWKLWLDRGLLILGVSLIIAGIGYFFAHNWQSLSENDKLGLAGGSVLIFFLGSIYAGPEAFIGKLLLLAASLLVGVFIAVFGQIYESGADTYELFKAWDLLILPWVILGRFVPLWLFWLGLANLAVGFYWPVSNYFFLGSQETESCFHYETLSLFALNFAALSLREWASWAKTTWLDRQWSAWILLTATLVPVAIETTYDICQTWEVERNSWLTPNALFFSAVLTLAGIFYFGKVRPSLPAVALVILNCCWIVTFLAGRLVFSHNDGAAGQFFLMGILILTIFGSGVMFLRWISRTMSSSA